MNQRQDPEQLLSKIQQETEEALRGQLKIYLGAAPGVGKTYAMLHDAIEERAKGLDVVIGIIESHGREDIETLLKPLEVLPRLSITHHKKKYHELDLDGAIKRAPGLILIDEMAHTNPEGSRHNKRWQDIKELLEQGIDVHTTLNVQHIESLNDDISRIIQAPIQETVPDSMISMAHTIELIDLPPQDLLKRLQEGKIYVPEQAQWAKTHFFRLGNLIALREFALRTTAERVNTEVLMYRQGEKITEIWPTQEKILVCVDESLDALKLIRAAKKSANALQTPWFAIHVETPRHPLAESSRNRVIQHLRLAELLGAETHLLTGTDIVQTILDYAHQKNITRIMIIKHLRAFGLDWFRKHLVHGLIRHCGEIDLYIMSLKSGSKSFGIKPFLSPPWKPYNTTMTLIACSGMIALAFIPGASTTQIALLDVAIITWIAQTQSIRSSWVAGMVGGLIYAYLTHWESWVSPVGLVVLTQWINQRMILTQRQLQSTQRFHSQTAALYAFSKQLTQNQAKNQQIMTSITFLANTFQSEVLILIPHQGKMISYHAPFQKPILSAKEQSIATWVYEKSRMAGLGTDTLSFSKALYLPLKTPQGSRGVLSIKPNTGQLFTPEQMHLLELCANQLAQALNAH